MSLELENKHTRDNNISFEEKEHIYTIKGDSTFTSVTTLVHSHFSEFDADSVIKKIRKKKNYKECIYFGKTDKQIKDYLKSRYSEFILYRPEVNKNTWLLWGSPVLVVLLGLLILLRHNRQPKPSANKEVPKVNKESPSNTSDQQRLAELLGDKENQQ